MSFYVSRTPFRISFFGGGTDYPEWYEAHGGAVLSVTINKYCYVSCRYLPPYFNIRHRIVWSHIETVNNISEILHPAVREGLQYLGFDDSKGLEIHHQSDLPARAGMGSSSSFAVGLIQALKALRGEPINKVDLAKAAIALERDHLKEAVGLQDQAAVAHGGLNLIRFHQGGEIDYTPIRMKPKRMADLDAQILLFFTGMSRLSSDIAAQMVSNMSKRAAELHDLQELVARAKAILEGDEALDEFGHLLHQTWQIKKKMSASITNDYIDGIYKLAMENGALGGKLLGAGHSGFMIFYVPLDRQSQVIKALNRQLHVPFNFVKEGSEIIYSPENANSGE